MDLSFPLLSYDDILESLDILYFMRDARVTKKDFLSPDPIRWRNIYASFFEHISNVKIEDVIQRKKLHTTVVVQNSDIFEDGAALMMFAKIMGRLMEACDVQNFGINDLIMPQDSKRLKLFVSALINFMKFKHSFLESLMEVEVKHEERASYFLELKRANDELRQQIDQRHETRLRDEEECAKVQQDYGTLLQEMSNLRGHEMDLTAAYNEASARKVDREKHNDMVASKIEDIEKKGKSLRAAIVQSPAHCRDVITRLTVQTAKVEEETSTQRDKFRQIKQHGEERGGMLEILEDAVVLKTAMNTIAVNIKQKRDCNSEQQRLTLDEQRKTQRINKETEEKKDAMAKCQEVYAKLKLQYTNMLASLEQTKQEYIQRKQSGKNVWKEKGAEFERQHDEIKTKIDTELEKLSKDVTYFTDMKQLILDKLEESTILLMSDWKHLLAQFGLDKNSMHTHRVAISQN